MGLYQKFLPKKKVLEEEYKNIGHKEFVRIYGKYEILYGTGAALDFIDKKIKQKTK